MPTNLGGSSPNSTRIAVPQVTLTTPVRALAQMGEHPNLAREGDPIGLTTDAGGFARPRPPFGRCPGLTTVVTDYCLRDPVEISENSPNLGILVLNQA